MKGIHDSFGVSTNKQSEMLDITSQVAKIVKQSGITSGHVLVYCPHTTAAITINENADPSVVHDILLTLDDLVPRHRSGYRHMEGNSDAHVKSSMFGCSEHIPLANGKMLLGTWQGIYFCEFDGPRSRKVNVEVAGEKK